MKAIRILTLNNNTVYPVLNRNVPKGFYNLTKLAKAFKARADLGTIFLDLRNVTL